MLLFHMLTFKWHLILKKDLAVSLQEKVNAFEMHLEEKLHAKCKINSFEMRFKCIVSNS